MIVFVSNFYNHHQRPLAEELFELTDGGYRFVELVPMPESFKASGYPQYNGSPLLIQAWRDTAKATDAIINADVVLYGNISDYSLIKRRLDDGKITFEVGERWLKKGLINALSPRFLKFLWNYYKNFRGKPLYRLCASAFAANDLTKFGAFKGRCYKWGYFTTVPELDVEKILETRSGVSRTRILAIARFLSWKHHELSVQCVKNLLDRGYDVELDIYGSGPEYENIEKMIESLGIQSRINLKGNIPNDELLDEIKRHDIMLFTSDRHEGWGAVVNEAMANACPVVGSDAVGSVPFLIRDGENGMIFRSGNVEDLTQKVETLVKDSDLRLQLSRNAYHTMRDVWSPHAAARRLLRLIDSLMNERPTPFEDGPCSPTH